MAHLRRGPLRAGVTLAVLAVVSVACGGDDGASSPGDTTAGDGGVTTSVAGEPAAPETAGGETTEVPADLTSAEEYYLSVEGLTGQERTDRLVADASENGSPLSIYSGLSDTETLAAVFEEEYGIEVDIYRANSETVLQRVMQEHAAGRVGADITIIDDGAMHVVATEGLLFPYRSDLLDEVVDGAVFDEWIGTTQYVFVVGWNTDLVPEGSEPTSFEDLTNEEWAGLVGLEVGDVDWYAALLGYYVDNGLSEDEAEDFLRSISANSQVSRGHTAMVELMSAGQFAILASAYSHGVDQAAAAGAPVAWKTADGSAVEPLVVKYAGFGLNRAAANPAAAVLWADFELGLGQDIYEEQFRIGTVDLDDSAIAGMEIIETPIFDLLEEPVHWEERYALLLNQ